MDYDGIRNLPLMFYGQAERLAEQPFLWRKRGGAWSPMTWREVSQKARALARGLKKMGVRPGDRVALVSENRPEWLIADIAIMTAGAVTVPTYVTNTVDDHRHILSDSGSKLALVSTPALTKTFLPAAASTGMGTVVLMEPDDAAAAHGVTDGVTVTSWQEVLDAGGEAADEAAGWLEDVARTDTACIIYTSGTSGLPKGVMLSHGAIICNCMGAHDILKELPDFDAGSEVFLSFLPLSHSYEHTAGQFLPISIGAQIYYAEGIDKLNANIGEVRPTLMTAVPRLYESMHARIRRGVEQTGGLKRKMFDTAVALGSKAYEDPAGMGVGDRLKNRVLEKLVRDKVRGRFGGRLKAFVSGGAPLNYDIGVYFTALGLHILQGYGQTESAPVVSCNHYTKNKIHTVGPPMKGVQVKIAEDGEILVRGELVMQGYWNNPEATAETIRDGWLHTGDIGRLDEDGYIEITDRKKDIIINSGGDNLSPARVEGVLSAEPEIAQAMVYGDRRPHLVALIVPEPEFLADWSKGNGAEADPAALAKDDELRKALHEAIDRANEKLSIVERVRQIMIAPEPFTIENEMMTPTMKLRRHVIKERYGAALEGLYGG